MISTMVLMSLRCSSENVNLCWWFGAIGFLTCNKIFHLRWWLGTGVCVCSQSSFKLRQWMRCLCMNPGTAFYSLSGLRGIVVGRRAGVRADKPRQRSLVRNFLGLFSNLARTFNAQRSRTSLIMVFCLTKYAHNGPFNEPNNFGIPELIFAS